MSNGSFRFRRHDSIGTVEAETDKFLSDCFVDTGLLNVIQNLEDHHGILCGRTGSGKTALLLKLNDREERAFFVNPENLALSYVSNSTILRFLLDLGISLDIFFKLLWRHVFAVELIQKRFNIEDENKAINWLDFFRKSGESKKRKEAVDYLNKWGSSFWKTTDYRVKEVTSKLEDEIQTQIGFAFPLGKIEAGAAHKLEEDQKADIIHRAQDVINSIQIAELTKVIDFLDEVLDDPQKRYYIFIDKLDERWVEDTFRFRLIRALIETTRDFHTVRHAKIIAAIRKDLLWRVFDETRGPGFQQEKYESRCLQITWTRTDLEEILNQRVNRLVQRRYTKSEPVNLRDIITGKVNRIEDPIEYILDRTLLRPRDAIYFLNCAINKAEGEVRITQSTIKEAEGEYSESRLHALADEWQGYFSNLLIACELIRGYRYRFHVNDVPIKKVEDLCIQIMPENIQNNNCRIATAAFRVFEEKMTLNEFRNYLFIVFYHVGLIGIKFHHNQKLEFSSDKDIIFQEPKVDEEMLVEVHKTFWGALDIKIRD